MSPSANYKSVSLFSITPDEPLPFHLAVHYKGQYLLYRNPGQCLDVAKYNRFIYKRIGQVYVPAEEYDKFLAYQEAKHKEEQQSLYDPTLSSEQRLANKIIYDIRYATKDLFLLESDAAMETSVKQVIHVAHDAVEQALSKPYSRIFESMPERSSDIIAHSMRVSLISTYLAYQLGFVNPVALEYLAAAALLHDVGKTRLQLSDSLEPDEADASELEIMKQHPIKSCELIEKMAFVPEEVIRIIREHHENRDGSGYPNGVRGPKLYGLSKVFAIANTFDNIVSEEKGDRATRYAAAIKKIGAMRNEFDPVLLPKALKILGQKA